MQSGGARPHPMHRILRPEYRRGADGRRERWRSAPPEPEPCATHSSLPSMAFATEPSRPEEVPIALTLVNLERFLATAQDPSVSLSGRRRRRTPRLVRKWMPAQPGPPCRFEQEAAGSDSERG